MMGFMSKYSMRYCIIRRVMPERMRMTSIFFQNDRAIVTTAIRYAMNPPTNGARNIKRTTLMISPPAITLKPAWATAAPAKPPMSVCDDEEGMPNHQVKRFQKVAARRPANITQRSMARAVSLCS